MIKQLSVFVENRPGRVAELLRIFGEANVNLNAVTVADTETFGIIRAVVEDTDGARELLSHHGIVAAVNDVICVEANNEPGSLGGILESLSAERINIEYLYTAMSQTANSAEIIIRVDDAEKAERILRMNGYVLR